MKKTKTTTKSSKVAIQSVRDKNITWPFYLLVFIFSFILYGNTLNHQYALDDLYAITGNKYTQQGFSGIPQLLTKDFFAGYYDDQEILLTGGRYRPLSLVTFAVEHQFFGDNPGFSHFMNLLLYALTGCLLYLFLRKLFQEKVSGKWFASVPLIATLLFLAHPVHTEVVANIKGRDEILSLLGSILAAIFYLKYLEQKSYKYLIYSFISFFLACLSKENAILFLMIIPLSVYYFRDFKIRENLFALLPLFLAGLLFILIRMSVVGGFTAPPSTELLDNPFIQADFLQKYATILFTLGLYIKLLFIPHPLTWDYYPYHITLKDWSDIMVIISLLVYIILVIIAVSGLRKKTMISFSIWVYLLGILLVSNILFQVGVFMAERFLYLPSLAFSLALAWLVVNRIIPLIKGKTDGKMFTAGIMLVILSLFTIKTISRNTAWKDDFTLHTTDIETSANSAKGNSIAGQWYAWAANQQQNAANRDALMAKAHELVSKAVIIHPTYSDAWFKLGNIVFDYRKDVDSTVNCYIRVLRKDPNEENVFRNLSMVINSQEDKQRKIELWEKILLVSPDRYEPNFYLANFYYTSDPDKSISFAEKARLARPDDLPNLKVLANGYLNQRIFDKALPLYDHYLKLAPEDQEIKRIRDNLANFLRSPE
ncbi:MAG: glycosyltransferase family 39 protein [Bacteroidales bacterium]